MFDGGNRSEVARNRRGCVWIAIIFTLFVLACSQIILAPIVLDAAASGTGFFASLLGTVASNPGALETAKVDVQQAVAALAPLVRIFLLFFTGVATLVIGVIASVIVYILWPRQS